MSDLYPDYDFFDDAFSEADAAEFQEFQGVTRGAVGALPWHTIIGGFWGLAF